MDTAAPVPALIKTTRDGRTATVTLGHGPSTGVVLIVRVGDEVLGEVCGAPRWRPGVPDGMVTVGRLVLTPAEGERVSAARDAYILTRARTITVSAPVGRDGWQVVSRDPVSGGVRGADLGGVELSAADLGCVSGTVCRVALLDEEDREIRAVEIAAR